MAQQLIDHKQCNNCSELLVDKKIFNQAFRRNTVASKPILLYVNNTKLDDPGIENFCKINTTGTKLAVGKIQNIDQLKDRYSDVIFVGYKSNTQLAHYYANADVFVFTNQTETVDVSVLEAMACGTPIAMYPFNSCIKFIKIGVSGYANNDIEIAIANCLCLDRLQVETYSRKYCY